MDSLSGFGGLEGLQIAREHQDTVQEFVDNLSNYLLARAGMERVDKMFKDVAHLRDKGGMDYGEALRWYYVKIIKKEFDI